MSECNCDLSFEYIIRKSVEFTSFLQIDKFFEAYVPFLDLRCDSLYSVDTSVSQRFCHFQALLPINALLSPP